MSDSQSEKFCAGLLEESADSRSSSSAGSSVSSSDCSGLSDGCFVGVSDLKRETACLGDVLRVHLAGLPSAGTALHDPVFCTNICRFEFNALRSARRGLLGVHPQSRSCPSASLCTFCHADHPQFSSGGTTFSRMMRKHARNMRYAQTQKNEIAGDNDAGPAAGEECSDAEDRPALLAA